MSRNLGIQIHFSDGTIPLEIKQKYDIEFSSSENIDILWIHAFESNYKPFDKELFQYLDNVINVYNRILGTDHLDLFIEVGEIDEYGLEIDGKKYQNIRFSELSNIIQSGTTIYLKREL